MRYKKWYMGLLWGMMLFVAMNVAVFAAENTAEDNCPNGVCNLADHQDREPIIDDTKQ